MNGYGLAIATIVLVLVLVGVPLLAKMYLYKKLAKEMDGQNLDQAQKDIDSFMAKMSFTAFEREAMRLSLLEMKNDLAQADKQIQMMENMRLSAKQKAALGERGFYVYLAQGKIKKAEKMVSLVRDYGSEQQYENLQIQYSVLLKKESKYIDALKKRLESISEQNMQADSTLRMQAGMFQYLIGLQYSYLSEDTQARNWLEKAQANLKGTPFEEDAQKVLETLG